MCCRAGKDYRCARCWPRGGLIQRHDDVVSVNRVPTNKEKMTAEAIYAATVKTMNCNVGDSAGRVGDQAP
jgi:hypothetical protein